MNDFDDPGIWLACWCCKDDVAELAECENCEIVFDDVPHGQQARCVTHGKENEPVTWEAWPS